MMWAIFIGLGMLIASPGIQIIAFAVEIIIDAINSL